MLVADCDIRNAAERSHLLPRFVIWLVKMWCFKVDAFLPLSSLHMRWRNMRRTSGVSQTFNETTGFGSVSAQVRTFLAPLLILIVNFLQYYQEEINLEHGNNCSDEVLPNSRPALSDQQSNERNPMSYWTQCVAKIQKSETCLRIPKPMATSK